MPSASLSRRIALAVPALAVPALLLSAADVRADVKQPNGKLIPVTLNGQTMCDANAWGSVQACLDKNEIPLGGRAGAISAVHDASIDQERRSIRSATCLSRSCSRAAAI